MKSNLNRSFLAVYLANWPRVHPEQDFAVLRAAASLALKYSPAVALDADLTAAYRCGKLDQLCSRYFGFWVDLSGTERLHRGKNPAALLWRDLRCRGFSPRLAVAPTSGAAWALSRYQHDSLSRVTWRELLLALARLPVAALRLPEETVSALTELGILTLQQLFTMAPAKLTERFGPLLLERRRQALGELLEPLEYLKAVVEPPPVPQQVNLAQGREPELTAAAAERLRRQLVRILGRSNLCRMARHFSHLPERFFSYRPLFSKEAPPPAAATPFAAGERPYYLLPQPEELQIVTDSIAERPIHLSWKGYAREIKYCSGPERLAPEWWRAAAPSGERDYFKVQDQTGHCFWIYQDRRRQNWYLQGVWV